MKVYNTLTNKREELIPIQDKTVSIYACGPTVYDYFHIGNARPFIIFDTLRRYLEYRGYEVRFVQNFTDIDDKMIRRANEEGITVKELGERFINEYFIDARGLGIRPATVHPKATEHIDDIISLIEKLIASGAAYAVDGDVYFSTKHFDQYGKLSHQPLEDLEAGARIDVNDQKRDPMDFAVWKSQKPNEPAWESPWGMGRPGWHIECSAMANRYLGETIDIHCGGQDLVFPHHENEIAQSECANGKPFAHYWMHNGYINIDGTKMSKSLGNFFTVRDIAAKYGYAPIRFFMLSAHYKSPINFSQDAMDIAKNSLERLVNCFEALRFRVKNAQDGGCSESVLSVCEKAREAFIAAMDFDLNTADAIAAIFDFVRQINAGMAEFTDGECAAVLNTLTELCDVLGITPEDAEDDLSAKVEALIEERNQARKEKNWARADEIRDQLKAEGIILEDTPQGVKWKRA